MSPEKEKGKFFHWAQKELDLDYMRAQKILRNEGIKTFNVKKVSEYKKILKAWVAAHAKLQKRIDEGKRAQPCPAPGCNGFKTYSRVTSWGCTEGGDTCYFKYMESRVLTNIKENAELFPSLTKTPEELDARNG
jgi:hypothetical protein